MTILVVDDTDGCRLPMSRLLRSEGYETVCARNGVEALHVLEEATPAAVLLDLSMPVMGGLAVLRAMREVPRLKGLPVIVISGEASDAPFDEARALGAKDVLVKSKFSTEELLGTIRRHVGV